MNQSVQIAQPIQPAQPIRAYPFNLINFQAITKLNSNYPNSPSPLMKKRLIPISDNKYLLQLSSAIKCKISSKYVSPSALDSPLAKLRLKNVKSPNQESQRESDQFFNSSGIQSQTKRNSQILSYSDKNSPPKIRQSLEKFYIKRTFAKEDLQPSLVLKELNLMKKESIDYKQGRTISHSMHEKKEQLVSKLNLTKNDFFQIGNKVERRNSAHGLSKSIIMKPQSPKKNSGLIEQQKQNHILTTLRSASNPILLQKSISISELEKVKSVNYLKLVFQKSQAGQNIKKQTKTNQDSMFYCSNYNGLKSRSLIGVCDGHGTYGHFVSQIIKKILPQHLDSQLKQQFVRTPAMDELGVKEETQVLRAFAQAFQKTSREINSCGVDVTFSGTTCVTVLMTGQHIWCANIGDSRAVLYFLKNGMWNIQPLSNDHKPDNPIEMKRIQKAQGRVEPYFGEDGQSIGPYRVWLQNDQIPGLAMSRSFGDYVASTVGVVAEPEVTYFKADFDSGFLIVASDGVWEFLSNDTVCEILQNYPTENVTVNILDQMATQIIKQSTKQWQIQDDVIDDISVIIGFISK